MTHLEIVTLAYAAMNFVIYIFWWNKPLNVNRPIRVFLRSDSKVVDEGTELLGSGGSESREISDGQMLRWKAISEGLENIGSFIIGAQDEDVDLRKEDRVPTFWAAWDGGFDMLIADAIVLVVGIIFGGIHCIAWFFTFPTHKELLLWRISSVAIAAVPLYIPSVLFALALLAAVMDSEFTLHTFFPLVLLPPGILYIIGRAATLVLAFMSLRNLPPGAYETVHWTTFIPHV